LRAGRSRCVGGTAGPGGSGFCRGRRGRLTCSVPMAQHPAALDSRR
jgi:hypothetical protein